jgi:hypothetical protein
MFSVMGNQVHILGFLALEINLAVSANKIWGVSFSLAFVATPDFLFAESTFALSAAERSDFKSCVHLDMLNKQVAVFKKSITKLTHLLTAMEFNHVSFKLMSSSKLIRNNIRKMVFQLNLRKIPVLDKDGKTLSLANAC